VIADNAKEAGVDKFLSKPLFPSSIAEIINECLGMDSQQTNEEQAGIAGIFAGRRILLAEDVEINREIVEALLEPTQLRMDFAENGRDAVRMFSEAPDKYDMIFMDVQMPEMDGYEATRRIRALDVPNARTIPIIAMTANVFREDVERCLEAGMNSHLGKPVEFNDMIESLRAYLPA
jgi:CheY-like chemotaxis protein